MRRIIVNTGLKIKLEIDRLIIFTLFVAPLYSTIIPHGCIPAQCLYKFHTINYNCKPKTIMKQFVSLFRINSYLNGLKQHLMHTPLNIDEDLFNYIVNLWRATNQLYQELPVQLRKKKTSGLPIDEQNSHKWQHILYFGSSKKKSELLTGLENLHQQIPMIQKLNEDLKKEEKTYRCLLNRVQKCMKDSEDLECATVHVENKLLMLESLISYHDERFTGNRFWNKLINSSTYQAWQQTNQTYLNQLNDCTEKYIALREDLEQKAEEIHRYNLHLQNIDTTVVELEQIIERFARQQEQLSAKYRIY